MYCELLFLLFLAPVFIYISAIVYHIDSGRKSVNAYFVELLTLPIISTFFLLLILNFFADFINYKKIVFLLKKDSNNFKFVLYFICLIGCF